MSREIDAPHSDLRVGDSGLLRGHVAGPTACARLGTTFWAPTAGRFPSGLLAFLRLRLQLGHQRGEDGSSLRVFGETVRDADGLEPARGCGSLGDRVRRLSTLGHDPKLDLSD